MASDYDPGRSVLFQSAHRAKSGLESPMIGFDSVVGVPGGVMECRQGQALALGARLPSDIDLG